MTKSPRANGSKTDEHAAEDIRTASDQTLFITKAARIDHPISAVHEPKRGSRVMENNIRNTIGDYGRELRPEARGNRPISLTPGHAYIVLRDYAGGEAISLNTVVKTKKP